MTSMEDQLLEREGPAAASVATAPRAAEAAPTGAEGAWTPNHPVNFRISIPLLVGRYYVTIVAGPERRNAVRRRDERRRHPMITAGNLFFIAVLGSVVGLAALAALNLLTIHLFGQG